MAVGLWTFRRNVGLLSACQALFFCCNTVLISTAPLVGLQIAPDPSLATLGMAAMFFGSMATTMPASLWMKRVGRRLGLMTGACFALLAGALAWRGVMDANFALFCAGCATYGCFSAFAQFFRFAAVDAADAAGLPAMRPKAIAWVLAGGVVAAIAGPEIAKATSAWFAPILFAGCYVAIALLGAGVLLLANFIDLPPSAAAERAPGGRSTLELLRQPDFARAFGSAVVAYVTMNLLMTATPLAMIDCGFAFEDSAFVIQVHVLGMFVPSFFTGNLIARYGAERIVALGALINLCCIAVALQGIELGNFAIGLLLLGVGWNFMFIGGTTLLSRCHAPNEKARVQGLNDFFLAGCVGLSAASSGFLHDVIGWDAMNLAAIPALALIIALLAPRLLERAPQGA